MRLKLVTSAFFVILLALLLGSPVLLESIPGRSAPKEQRRAYAMRTLGYFGCLIFAFAGAGVGSFLIYRRARRDYEEESVSNLKALLDAPLKPPKEPQESADDGA